MTLVRGSHSRFVGLFISKTDETKRRRGHSSHSWTRQDCSFPNENSLTQHWAEHVREEMLDDFYKSERVFSKHGLVVC